MLGIKDVCSEFHGPQYVAGLMKEMGIEGIGHHINETILITHGKMFILRIGQEIFSLKIVVFIGWKQQTVLSGQLEIHD